MEGGASVGLVLVMVLVMVSFLSGMVFHLKKQ